MDEDVLTTAADDEEIIDELPVGDETEEEFLELISEETQEDVVEDADGNELIIEPVEDDDPYVSINSDGEQEEIAEPDDVHEGYEIADTDPINDNIATLDTLANIREGDEVAIMVVNGEPIVIGTTGGGDRTNENILDAKDIASEAAEVANAINQHFWHDTNGAHVTDDTQEAWEAEYAKEGHGDLANPTDEKPWYNQLMNSLGSILRTGLTNLAAWTRSAITFYDGLGNSENNIVALFGKTLARIGYETGVHTDITSSGMSVNDGDDQVAFIGQEYQTRTLFETNHTYSEWSPDGVYKIANFHISSIDLGNLHIFGDASYSFFHMTSPSGEGAFYCFHFDAEAGTISRPIEADVAELEETDRADMLSVMQYFWDDCMNNLSGSGTFSNRDSLGFGGEGISYTTDALPYAKLSLGHSLAGETALVARTLNRDGVFARIIHGNDEGYGDALLLGDGGLTIIGGGEAADNLYNYMVRHFVSAAFSDPLVYSATEETEQLHLAADGNLFLHAGCQTIENHRTCTLDGNGYFYLPYATTAVNDTRDANNGGTGIYLRDSEGIITGNLHNRFLADGRVGTELYARRMVNDSWVYNAINMYVDASGNRTVVLSDKEPWRNAIGASSGIWPIAIGGTGQSGTTETNLPLNSACQAYNSDVTPTYAKWGKVVQVCGAVKPKSEVAAGGSFTIGTLPSGYRPRQHIYQLCQGSGNSVWMLTVNTNGTLTAGRYRNGASANAAMTTSVWLPFNATFIVD